MSAREPGYPPGGQGARLREVRLGEPAHGGHVVARHEGRVVFVRHGAPGELVDVLLTEAEPDARFWRGDAVAVREASADRVAHVWPVAGPGGVGGAELGHLTLAAQRAWKRDVLVGTLRRIGHLEVPGLTVAPAPGDERRGGLHTRTRVELVADGAGRPAMYRHRSHTLLPVEDVPLAVHAIGDTGALRRTWRAGTRLDLVAAGGGAVVLADGEPVSGRRIVTESVTAGTPDGEERTWSYRVAASGFWQVHLAAPGVLVERVLAAADLVPGEQVLELYSGAGLLTLPLADAVGPTGGVTAVEADGDGARLARRNARAHPWVHLVAGDVARVLRDAPGTRPDVVVLDPPRAGAGQRVMDAITSLTPRRIVYVACDPAALARDAARAVAAGYSLTGLTAHDLFPHTHHLEAVAVLDREAA